MSGKRLVDLAALFNASRGVAQKHIALRSRQVDVYNRTSTLARAVRNQTERVTETTKAASFLLSRLNESAPSWTSEAQEKKASQQWPQDPIPSRESTGTTGSARNETHNGLEQDHFYEKSSGYSAVDKQPVEDLKVTQEQASRYPLPDGTIPSPETDINTHELDNDVTSIRPSDELPKHPLGNEGLQPITSKESTIPISISKPLSADAARTIQRQSELQIPSMSADALGETSPDPLEEGHDEDSFYRKSGHTSPTFSSLPRVKIPKHPSDIQEGDAHLKIGQLNSDSYYSARKAQGTTQIPSVETEPEQEQIPEGINTDLFYSPRVARLLGGKTQGGIKQTLDLKGVRGTPVEKGALAEGKDQDTFNVGGATESIAANSEFTSSTVSEKLDPSTDKDADIESLAEEIVKATAQDPIKVSHLLPSHTSILIY